MASLLIPSTLPGLRLLSSSSAPLWDGKDGTGPFAADQLGLVGGLSQILVSSQAVTQYGTLGNGLQLPLPAVFVAAHPGVLEVYVRVLRFSNSRAPVTLLRSPDYNRQSAIYNSTLRRISSTTINGGWTYSAPNSNGETLYMFQWANGDYWNEVTVVGNGISVTHAMQIAKLVR